MPTKVCLVKAMVFPVVMYGCESCTIKRLSAEELILLNLVLDETLESLLDFKEINLKSILKEINPGYSLERLMLKFKLPYFGHWKRP